jgi:hypothetical protein
MICYSNNRSDYPQNNSGLDGAPGASVRRTRSRSQRAVGFGTELE